MSGIAEIALFTDDVEAAKAFYGDLLSAEPEAEWLGGALFAAGSAKLLVHQRGTALEGDPPNEDHFAFTVRNLDAVCRELKDRGCALLFEPRDYPWGRSAYLRDPDGRLVELSELDEN
ncbi:MAG: VOC family protein [Actinobacteria bacterium]|nr:VOC family protein [Actinomycetota bacterium]